MSFMTSVDRLLMSAISRNSSRPLLAKLIDLDRQSERSKLKTSRLLAANSQTSTALSVDQLRAVQTPFDMKFPASAKALWSAACIEL